jgi:hypothetical protein
MKKLIFVLAIFIAAPAFAALQLAVVDNADGTCNIEYSGADAGNLPRAFALELAIDEGGQFTAISNYYAGGECNNVSQGYGIFPGSIVIDTAGDVSDWGDPVAADGSPGAQDQTLIDGSSDIVLEFASLYMDPNAPATSGVLCTLTFDCGGTPSKITLTEEDTYRGGVVLEDGTQVDLSADVNVCDGGCYTGQPDEAEWIDAGSPDCWCYPKQCHGDADGLQQGTTKTGYYAVGTNDLTVLTGAWKVLNVPKGPGLTGNQGCADFDHLKQGTTKTGYYRVGTNDLTILTTYWKVLEPTKGPGVPGDCLPGTVTP